MSFMDSHGNSTDAYTAGTVPVKSLSAVSATGPGTALDGLAVRATAVMVVSSSAGVSAGSVQLQGSLDGTNYYNLGSAVSTSSASAPRSRPSSCRRLTRAMCAPTSRPPSRAAR